MGHDGFIAGKYRLAEKLGEGSFGIVWRAHDVALERDVAIKEILFPAGMPAEEAEALEKRTLREARAAAKLSNHPSIVVVHEVVYEDGRPWIVMELLRGPTLDRVVRNDGPQPPQRVAAIGAGILAGLQAAHAVGVVHRDVKPSNVMLHGERAVLTDFGIAALEGGTMLTQTGNVVGTPAFMAPERARGQPATPASDLWALGATLYAAVEGRPPFEADSVAAVLGAVLEAKPRPPTRAGPLAPVIAGLLVKDPDRRAPAAVLADQLARVASGGPVPPPRKRRTALVLGSAAAAIALAGTLIWQPWQLWQPGDETGSKANTPSNSASTAETPGPTSDKRRFPSTVLESDTDIDAIAFSPYGTRVAAGGQDGIVRGWDVQQRDQTTKAVAHKSVITDLEYNWDGSMLATASFDKTVRVWDLTDQDNDPVVLTGTGDEVWAVDFSPDGKTLASASKDHTIRIWDIASRKTTKVLRGHQGQVTGVAFSPDGKILASGSWDTTVRLWNTDTWDQQAVLKGHTRAVHGLDFSPDGRTLAAGGEDGQVLIWNVSSHATAGVLTDADQNIRTVDFSPNGKTLASGNWQDHNVTLWDVATNTRIAVLTGHEGPVVGVEFSPDGKTLASGSLDNTVRLWDLTR